ncbi:MAG: HEPN domain-containing protein [Ignavibacteriae bacterium]|nr:HEPN domain-containing protein [Ignavibacteriota bacterium]
MKNGSHADVARYRFEKAILTLKEGRDAFALRNYGNAVGRAYYAIFSGMRALLAVRNLDSKTHSGVLSLFNQHFIKENLLPKGFGKLARDAKNIRERADYGDFEIITRDTASEYVEKADEFLKKVEVVLRDLLLAANGRNRNNKK